jgi:hypothetical protein
MKLLGDSLAHAMHLATAARTRLLIVGQVILDPLTRQVRRQRFAAALLSRCAFDGWQARVRKFGDIVRFAAGIILVGGLLGFIEQTVDVLFAARRKTMQACQRQFFLEPDDALRELTILHLQRSNARQQRFDTRFAGSIHRILESEPYRRVNRSTRELSRQPDIAAPDGGPSHRYRCRQVSSAIARSSA